MKLTLLLLTKPYLQHGFRSHIHIARSTGLRTFATRQSYGTSTALQSASSEENVPTLVNTLERTLDWTDRIGLQDRYTLQEKGWEVQVDWRATAVGAGLFAMQDIADGTVLRRGILGVNLKEFQTVQDIEDFCNIEGNQEEKVVARRNYVKDYLWGFYPNADERGYVDKPEDDKHQRFFGMWIPGNGLNHSEEPNSVYVATPNGIDLIALGDISKDDELFDDYRRHGTSPEWLKDFSQKYQVTLNFADCNDFV